MSEPLTRADLFQALDTQSDVLKRELADRFEHYEKRHEKKHEEMMRGFDEVITDLKAHIDDRFDDVERRLTTVEQLITVKDRVDKMQVFLTEQFGRDVLARAGL